MLSVPLCSILSGTILYVIRNLCITCRALARLAECDDHVPRDHSSLLGFCADGYLAREEIEKLAAETKEIQRQHETRRNYGFQVDMLDDPRTVLEQAKHTQAIKAQLKKIEE